MKIAKEKFDALLSFDNEDSEKFELSYYPHLVPFPRKSYFLKKFKQKEKFFMGGGTVKYILWEGRKIDFRCLLKYINC